MGSGALGKCRIRSSQLGLVAGGLLQVVAEELVELDEILLGEPVSEPLVKLRTVGLRQRLVRRVADQQVVKAEAVLACDLCAVGADQLPPHQRGQPRRHLVAVAREGPDCAAMEDLALDGSAFEHPPLARIELVEPGGEQCLQRGRQHDLAVRFSGHRHHLLDEEWVPPGCARDPLAELAVDLPGHQPLHVVVGKRLEPERHRPAAALLCQLRPRHAEQQDRDVRRQQPDVLDEVEERLLAPLDVVEDHDEWPLGGGLLQRLPKGPGDAADAFVVFSPRSEPIAAATARSEGPTPSCITTSTTGQ